LAVLEKEMSEKMVQISIFENNTKYSLIEIEELSSKLKGVDGKY
jgi:hypothetical protein